ncbi:hypothetical protein L208DRAFT_485411 [Tricholoma matsutake]|nr:hypothetical protein L208DRAFT_485411 [Tricholoma matsutake 945]
MTYIIVWAPGKFFLCSFHSFLINISFLLNFYSFSLYDATHHHHCTLHHREQLLTGWKWGVMMRTTEMELRSRKRREQRGGKTRMGGQWTTTKMTGQGGQRMTSTTQHPAPPLRATACRVEGGVQGQR